MDMGNPIGSFFWLIAVIVLLVILFLIFRDMVCWYWKINERITLQKQQIELSKETNELLMTIINRSRKPQPEQTKTGI